MSLLEVRGLTRHFGGLAAVEDLSFDVAEGEIVGLIGPNGAGKSTTFNVITGYYRPTRGTVRFNGADVTGAKASRLCRLGLVRTFQHSVLFHEMTVADNVYLALRMSSIPAANRRSRLAEILEFTGLDEVAAEAAHNLPHGLQRLLGIAIGMGTGAKLLCLDEPLTGMNPTEVTNAVDLLQRLRKDWGITLLLVEHNMRAVMSACDRIVVLKYGRKLAEGTPEEVRANQDVLEPTLEQQSEPILEVQNLVVRYGKAEALKGISLTVPHGSITTLIGANGAGKTTLLRAISGLVSVAAGDIRFAGKSLARRSIREIVALGIGHVPEGRRLFPQMTVLENLESGAYLEKDRQEVQRRLERVLGHFPDLRGKLHQAAQRLSGGQQQMVALGRGLMANPRLLLLDEPSVGLAPRVVQEIGEIIREINANKVTVLLVEQNAQMALELADTAYVLETGSVVMTGQAAELLHNEQVRTAYIGA